MVEINANGPCFFNGDIDANGQILIIGGIPVTSNVTPTSDAGIELFRSSGGYGQIQAYDRDTSTLLGLYVNSFNLEYNSSRKCKLCC